MKSERTGKARTARYRARLNASREPPSYLVADEIMAAFVEAKLNGEDAISFAVIEERAAENVISDQGFSRAGFDTVLARFARLRNRKPRLA